MIARAWSIFGVSDACSASSSACCCWYASMKDPGAVTHDAGGDSFLPRALYLFLFRAQQVFIVLQPSLHRLDLGLLAGREGYW